MLAWSLAGWLAGWLASWVADWLAGWLACLLGGSLAGRLAGWLAGCLLLLRLLLLLLLLLLPGLLLPSWLAADRLLARKPQPCSRQWCSLACPFGYIGAHTSICFCTYGGEGNQIDTPNCLLAMHAVF